MKHDKETLAFYGREAAAYAARARSGEARALEAFLSRLTPGAHILDLGCGGGQDALMMMHAGYHVTAMDGSAALAAQAETRLGQPVRVQLFEDLDDRDAFDAVWANASLLHVPRPALPRVVANIHRALKTGGQFFASFKTGGGEGRDALGRYYNNPSKDQLRAVLPAPAWRILEIVEGQGPGYDGVTTGWLTLTAQKSCKRLTA